MRGFVFSFRYLNHQKGVFNCQKVLLVPHAPKHPCLFIQHQGEKAERIQVFKIKLQTLRDMKRDSHVHWVVILINFLFFTLFLILTFQSCYEGRKQNPVPGLAERSFFIYIIGEKPCAARKINQVGNLEIRSGKSIFSAWPVSRVLFQHSLA